MKRRLAATIFLFILLTSGCRNLMGDPLVGKWAEVGKPNSIDEYFSDGNLVSSEGNISINGKWQRLDDGRIKIEAAVFGMNRVIIATVKFEGDTATFTTSNGEVKKFTRVK